MIPRCMEKKEEYFKPLNFLACRFLILDPHYTGGEDLKIILDKVSSYICLTNFIGLSRLKQHLLLRIGTESCNLQPESMEGLIPDPFVSLFTLNKTDSVKTLASLLHFIL